MSFLGDLFTGFLGTDAASSGHTGAIPAMATGTPWDDAFTDAIKDVAIKSLRLAINEK